MQGRVGDSKEYFYKSNYLTMSYGKIKNSHDDQIYATDEPSVR